MMIVIKDILPIPYTFPSFSQNFKLIKGYWYVFVDSHEILPIAIPENSEVK